LLRARWLRKSGGDSATALELLVEAEHSGRDSGDRPLRAAALLEQAELHIESRNLEESRRCYQEADELHQAFAERLPHALRDHYLTSNHIGEGPAGEGTAREIPAEEPVSDPIQRDSARGGEVEVSDPETHSEQMLRVASLLTEAASASLPRVLIPKALACMVRAAGASQGWLLVRRGDEVRVICAADAAGAPLKGYHERLALAAVEDVWESGKSILAARVVDEPRVQAMEELYSSGVQSLAVIPLRADGAVRAVAYLADPEPATLTSGRGKTLLETHAGLLGLLLPRNNQVSARS
jgi:hypothetical protein